MIKKSAMEFIMLDNEPLRIGYIVRRYPRYSETFIVREIIALEKAGIEIEIFALDPPEDTHFQDIISKVKAPVNYMPFKGLSGNDFWNAIEQANVYIKDIWSTLKYAQGLDTRSVYYSIIIARLIHEKNIDRLHAHFANTATSVARLASILAKVPYTFTAHAYDIYSDRAQVDMLKQKLTDADAVITVSDYNLKYLSDNYGIDASCIKKIYCGLDLDNYTYSIPLNRKPIIVSVGRLVEKKGFNVLIDACSILKDSGCDFLCQIIGTGSLEYELNSQIKRLSLENKIQMLGAHPLNSVIQYISNAAVFVAPCIVGEDGNRDGLPTTLIESAAVGTPCIATDVTGIPELVRDGETGLLVKQNCPTELAVAIEKLLKDSALGIRLSKNARQLVEDNFDIKKNTKSLLSIFKKAHGLGQKIAMGIICIINIYLYEFNLYSVNIEIF